ncbi:hypothetical protein ACJX0J_007265 [Zea mays]
MIESNNISEGSLDLSSIQRGQPTPYVVNIIPVIMGAYIRTTFRTLCVVALMQADTIYGYIISKKQKNNILSHHAKGVLRTMYLQAEPTLKYSIAQKIIFTHKKDNLIFRKMIQLAK